jgi:hypothetical protein
MGRRVSSALGVNAAGHCESGKVGMVRKDVPQGLKAGEYFKQFTARLKSCPDTKPTCHADFEAGAFA